MDSKDPPKKSSHVWVWIIIILLIIIIVGVILYFIFKPSNTKCTDDKDCSVGDKCISGHCVAHLCVTSSDCPTGKVCHLGQCVSDDKNCNPACTGGLVCIDAQCVPEEVKCSSNGDCLSQLSKVGFPDPYCNMASQTCRRISEITCTKYQECPAVSYQEVMPGYTKPVTFTTLCYTGSGAGFCMYGRQCKDYKECAGFATYAYTAPFGKSGGPSKTGTQFVIVPSDADCMSGGYCS